MKITNQKPTELAPIYTANARGVFDPCEYIKESMAAPLFNPLNATQTVNISMKNNKTVDETFIAQQIVDCCGDTINIAAETVMKEIFGNTLVYFNKNTKLSIQETFAIQAGEKEKLPEPSPTTIYTPAGDVIPVSKEFLAGKCTYEKFFATLSFYTRSNTLGFYFATNKDFDDFKAYINSQVTLVQSILSVETNQAFVQFQTLDLAGLTESLILRNDDGDNNGELSFARLLIAYLMNYTTQISSALFGVLPFELGELYCPKTVVFVNVAKHARATSKEVADEWLVINNALQSKVKMISNNALNKLTTVTRQLQKARSQAATAVTNAAQTASRSSRRKFRKTQPSSLDIAKLINKVINKMATVAKSSNTYKVTKMTYAKPNRRDPDDFNKQGKMISTKYKPDIHVYIDTSGSISELHYQSTIKTLIHMAKKLNIDFYFNSFSHTLSQCTKLNTKDKSTKALYAIFQQVPKVSGGTDYEQIWHYINKSAKRRRELSLIITDFEYNAPNHYVKHPDNLYYLPCSNMQWDRITYWAENFCKSMARVDQNCKSRILM